MCAQLKMNKKISQYLLIFCLIFISINTVRADLNENSSTTWNLHNVDIKTVIEQVAKETNKNFILDSKVKGTVSVISSQPIEGDDIYEVFLSLLQVLGLTAIETGDITKIVPDSGAKYLGLPFMNQSGKQYDDVVVQVIEVKHISAPALVPVLRAMVSPQGHLAAYAGSNVILVADRANAVRQLTKIIQKVDIPDINDFDVVKLDHASASELANSLRLLNANRKPTDPLNTRIVITADDRSNSLILSGDKQSRLRIRTLIAHLDIAVPGDGNTEVIYLKYQKAEDMVAVLSNVITSYYGALSQRARQGQVQGGGNLSRINSGGLGSAYQPPRINRASSSSSASGTGTASTVGQGLQVDQRQAVGTVIGSFGVQAEPNLNALIVTAPPNLMRNVKGVIAKLDIRRSQVLVEAIIVEMNDDMAFDFGVDWRIGGGAVRGGLSSTNNTENNTLKTISDFTFNTGFNLGFIRHGSISALLSAFEKDTQSNVLATPSLVVLDNSKATLFVGETVPTRSSRYVPTGTDPTNDNLVETFTDLTAGTGLSIIPQITQDRAIKLDIEQTADGIKPNSVDSLQPSTTNRKLETSVLVDDGDILVLGGLIRSEETKIKSKVPFLGDLPMIGRLFSSDSNTSKKINLMIFLRPIILRDSEDNIQITGSKYNFIRDKLLIREHEDTYNPGIENQNYILPEYDINNLTLLDLPKPFTYM